MNKIFDVNLWVTGEQFLGREAEVEHLLRHVFRPALEGQNQYLALTGMNRIGKTSLVHEAWRRFDETPHQNVVVLEAVVSDHHDFWEFWTFGVLKPLYRKLKNQVGLSREDLEDIEELLEPFFSEEGYERLLAGQSRAIAEGKSNIMELFLLLREVFEVHVVLILDEFDLARQVFGARAEYFSWFRGLLQKGGGLSVVTVSRRSIDHIQLNSNGGSTLSGVFSKYGLFGFRNSELDGYFRRLEENGIPLSAQDRKSIYFYCGRSPYYLAIMGNALLEAGGTVDFKTVSCQFYSSFNAVLNLLREEKLLRAMLQMFVGPRYDLRAADAGRLVDMGYCMTRSALEVGTGGHEYEDYLQPKKTGEYLCVCHYFVEYLAEVSHSEVDDLWPKLTATEQKTRKLVEKEYRKLAQQEHGRTWQAMIWDDLTAIDPLTGRSISTEQKLMNFTGSFQSLYSRADLQSKQEVGNSALNVISLQELGELIYLRWDRCFRYYNGSGCSRSDIREAYNRLKDARNPYAHSNARLLTPGDIEEVDGLCDRLLTSILQELEGS